MKIKALEESDWAVPHGDQRLGEAEYTLVDMDGVWKQEAELRLVEQAGRLHRAHGGAHIRLALAEAVTTPHQRPRPRLL